jgi:hypothetical protein
MRRDVFVHRSGFLSWSFVLKLAGFLVITSRIPEFAVVDVFMVAIGGALIGLGSEVDKEQDA